MWQQNLTNNKKILPNTSPVQAVEEDDVPEASEALLNSSQGNDIVLDLFGGSGTTLIACEQLGRQARLMEIDPHYCDVIITRWETLTGKQARLLEA